MHRTRKINHWNRINSSKQAHMYMVCILVYYKSGHFKLEEATIN